MCFPCHFLGSFARAIKYNRTMVPADPHLDWKLLLLRIVCKKRWSFEEFMYNTCGSIITVGLVGRGPAINQSCLFSKEAYCLFIKPDLCFQKKIFKNTNIEQVIVMQLASSYQQFLIKLSLNLSLFIN
jgi:hypothetical protein